MSWVAAAVVGGAVIGGVASNKAAKESGEAVERGAETSAEAQLEATRLQIEETARQFDYQQQVLTPQIQQQYAAQRGYSDLLGIGGGAGSPEQQQSLEAQKAELRQELEYIQGNSPSDWRRRDAIAEQLGALERRPNQQAPQFPGPGATQFQRGDQGQFIDPNLDPTRLAESERLTDQVASSRLAPTDPNADSFRNYITDNQIAAPTLEEDARFARARDVTMMDARGDESLADQRGGVSMADQRGGVSLADQRGDVSLADQRGDVRLAGDELTEDQLYANIEGRRLADGAAGTGVYGEEFESSPGYEFQVEEMNRALDRRNSAGGNFGGRAIMEAQRRAQGVAAQDYYNWAQGRTMDLQRQAQAEATDASRLDAAGSNYMARRVQDVARNDQFAAQDIARGDEFARTDIARGDEFARTDIARGDQFAATDIARRDQFAQTDIGRGDIAVDAYEQQRVADVGRGDAAYENYLQRRTQDTARMDAAVGEQDRLRAVDLQRSDQGYYNYLQSLSRQAGMGDAASEAVSASKTAAGQNTAAYAQQGSGLSQIYGNLGANQAQIQQNRYANMNNAVQSGVQNWMTYQMAQPGAGGAGTSAVRYNNYSNVA